MNPEERQHVISMIVAGPGSLFMSYRTILSVITWLVLARPGVKQLYLEPGP